MHRFYVEQRAVGSVEITITGTDVNHIKNVLRMKTGDSLVVCDGANHDYMCHISRIEEKEILLSIDCMKETESELPLKISLYQGLPKKDKMELIIQKSVELGVHEIIPVTTKRTVVKLEDKRKEVRKIERWQAISESAAKQSGRGMIPDVRQMASFYDALTMAELHEMVLIPYECSSDMNRTRAIIQGLTDKKSVGIFIGPEGGFEDEEVRQSEKMGAVPITLGNRILRTETAALMVLSFINYELG